MSHCDLEMIVGDFNYPNIDWENFHFDVRFDDFVETILESGLIQHVQQPTRNSATLDLIFSSDPDIISNIDILEPLADSDHTIALCDLNMTQHPKASTNLRSRCYHKADRNLYWEILSSVDWTTNLSDDSVDEIWNNFSTIIHNIIDKVAPSKPSKLLNAP